jgi:hypothetical protein
VGDILDDMREMVKLARVEKNGNPSRQYIILEGSDEDGLESTFREVAAGTKLPKPLTNESLVEAEDAQKEGGDHDEEYHYKAPYREYHMPKVSRLLRGIADGVLGGENDGLDKYGPDGTGGVDGDDSSGESQSGKA